MSRTDEQFAVMASSERLDKVLLEFRSEIDELDVDVDAKFGISFALAQLEGVATYLRKKKTIIAESQP